MKNKTRATIQKELTELIETWIINSDILDMPFISDCTGELMAKSALTVLVAIADAQECAIRDGYLEVTL